MRVRSFSRRGKPWKNMITEKPFSASTRFVLELFVYQVILFALTWRPVSTQSLISPMHYSLIQHRWEPLLIILDPTPLRYLEEQAVDHQTRVSWHPPHCCYYCYCVTGSGNCCNCWVVWGFPQTHLPREGLSVETGLKVVSLLYIMYNQR